MPKKIYTLYQKQKKRFRLGGAGVIVAGLTVGLMLGLSFFSTQKIAQASDPELTFVGSIQGAGAPKYLGEASGVFVSGNYAYVASHLTTHLTIIDISNPASPKFKGTLGSMMDRPKSVFVSGNYAYVVGDDVGSLSIVDISNPAHPYYEGSIWGCGEPNYLCYASSVFVSGNYAYVTSWYDRALTIIDITDSANPTLKGSINHDDLPPFTGLYAPMSVFVSGNYAYVADWYNAFTIIDITDPANPTFKGSVGGGAPSKLDEVTSVFVSGNYAYVAGHNSGLTIIDITDSANPTLKGSIQGAGAPNYLGGANSVFVSGNYAYVAASDDDALTVIDISNKSNPIFVDSIRGEGWPNYLSKASSVFVSGNYVYVTASGDDALSIFSFIQPLASDFSLSADPDDITALPTDNKTSTIIVTSINDFSKFVFLSANASNGCISTNFSNNPIKPPANGSVQSILFIAANNCPIDSYLITVKGKNFIDNLEHQIEINLTIIGKLDSPFNIKHIENTVASITWQWDAVENATGYEVYLEEIGNPNPACPDGFYPVCFTNIESCIITNHNADCGGGVLSANTQYTIKVKAVDSDGLPPNYIDSDLSDPGPAYTSANAPVNLEGTPVSRTEINWTWESGGAESGFYAQIKDSDPPIASGWQSGTSWTSTGLDCGQNYILQVKAKNADFDGCVSDCTGDETAWQSSDPVVINTLSEPGGAQLSDITNTSMKLTWLDTLNEEGYMVERAAGDAEPPAENYSQIYDTQAPDITLYNDTGLTQNTHYWYRVKAYSSIACDSGYAEADGWTKGPKIAINPIAYPIGNLDYHYNFGVLDPNDSKSVAMLICNLGDADLTVSSASIIGSESANFSFTPSDAPFILEVDSDYHNCDNNLAAQAKKQVVIKFTSQLSCDPGPITSQADFVLLDNDADKTVELKGVCLESPVGEGAGSENIIYDGRIMANPPPTFVEFLDKLQFSEKIKPR